MEDLYENFIIRLLRGSGLKGLVSFNQNITTYDEKLKLMRPIINIKKSDLTYVAKKVFNFKIEDPSNENINFKRVRIRKLIKELKFEGLNLEKLKLTINNLSASNLTINHYVDVNVKINSKYYKHKKCYMLNKDFFNQPNEIVFRSLTHILKKVGDKYYAPRGKSITGLLEKLRSNQLKKINISGCMLEKINNSLIISKEK